MTVTAAENPLRRRVATVLQRVMPRRLDRQVMLLATLVLGIAMPFFALHKAGEDADRVVESLARQAGALARNIAVTSVEGLIVQDFSSTEQLLLRSARFPGVMEIQLADPQGQVIADVVVGTDGEPRLRYVLQPLAVPRNPVARAEQRLGRLAIWEPVINAELVGWVRLTYSLVDAELIAERHLYDYLVDGIIMTALLIGLILVVMRRPLRVLRDAATFAGQLQNKGGEQIPIDRRSVELEQLGMALNDASGKLFAQDTAIKKALKQLSTQKSAMDEHSIVSISDVDGRITYANQKFLDVTGFSKEELTGRDHRIVNSGHHPVTFFRAMWTTICAGQVWHGEILNKGKDGRLIWMNTTIVPFVDEMGLPYEYVAIRTDVTAQKQVEQELGQKARSLQDMTDHLEDLVQQRTAELEDANRELQHLNNVKSEFVSIVSHELRTPLTSIKSFAEILEDDIDDLDSDSQRHYLSIINEESDRLGRLINDLLDLQKMDSGKMSWKEEPADLGALLQSCINFFTKAYDEKGLSLRLEHAELPRPVVLDVDRIRQLIANLLSNALKFTEHGGVAVAVHDTVRTLRIMVLGDDPGRLADIQAELGRLGAEVVAFADGARAIQALQASDDYQLAVLGDCAQTTSWLHTIRAQAPELPLLVVLGQGAASGERKLRDCGASACIAGTLTADQLAPIIEAQLGRALDLGAPEPTVQVSVTDTGLGIPRQELTRVFEHFHQVDSSETREKGGSGLGLAICQEIVEHYRGRIWAESQPGEGSRFMFTLPLAQDQPQQLVEPGMAAG